METFAPLLRRAFFHKSAFNCLAFRECDRMKEERQKRMMLYEKSMDKKPMPKRHDCSVVTEDISTFFDENASLEPHRMYELFINV